MSRFHRLKDILGNIFMVMFYLLAILVFIGVPISIFVSPNIDLRTGMDYAQSIAGF